MGLHLLFTAILVDRDRNDLSSEGNKEGVHHDSHVRDES